MTFGLQCDEPTSGAILDRAAEGGVDFLDTSDAYPLGGDLATRGVTEEILGRWLRGKRDRFIVATKCFAPTGPAPFDGGNSRKHILAAVEASLRRLQTDYIDLYQLHGYDLATPIDETLGALDDLVHQGKVRSLGCSNFLTYQLVRAVGRTETLRLARLDCVQPRYNLLFRQIEREMLPYCREEGIGVIPYNPLAGGLLTGKHSHSSPPPEGSRFTLGNAAQNYQDRYWHDREFDTVEILRQLSEAAGVSLVTLSVAWVLANQAITAPIIGASRPEQLGPSLAATAPTAMKSTPVSATALAVSSRRPPLASRRTAGYWPASATAARRSASPMLSSRMSPAPVARASRTCARLSHSTSSGRPGAAPRTARIAAAIPPAAATWLSFTSAASPSPMRWFIPPPQRTAYFSSWRSPGVVLRVSRTAHPVPATASAHALVAVAIPDRCVRKFSMVRSAPSISRNGARIRSTSQPPSIRSPSARRGSAASGGTPAASSTARATGRPASTPGWRATTPATARAQGAAVAAEVRSGP